MRVAALLSLASLAHAALLTSQTWTHASATARRPAAVICSAGADLAALTADSIRTTDPEELDSIIEQLEEANVNHRAANQGAPDVKLSRLLAVAHTSSGDCELAAPHAFAALQEGGPDAEMHFCLGLSAERRDQQDEALDEYEKAVAIDPECWRALFHVGKISLQFCWVADSVDYVRA